MLPVPEFARRVLVEQFAITLEEPLLLAVSGGADSIALARALQAAGFHRLHIGHFNHRLRGAASDSDQQFVQSQLADLPVHVGIAPSPIELRSGESLESAARKMRYDWLRSIAEQHHLRWVLTAHTADDQAETVLHRIIRGTGLKGLRGIPQRRPLSSTVQLLRPLLRIFRADILHYLTTIGQPYRVDESNFDRKFTRNRIRWEVLPLLKTFNPAIVDALVRLAEQAEAAHHELDQATQTLLRRAELAPGMWSVYPLRSASDWQICECFRLLWQRQGWPLREMSAAHWTRLLAIVRGSLRSGHFPGPIVARRQGGVVRIGPVATINQRQLIAQPHEVSSPMMRPIRRALLSVSDKTGLVELAKTLIGFGVELISTGGTRRTLQDAGVPVRDIAEVTGFPEMLDGRVKTLHPIIYAGLLARRDCAEHLDTIARHSIPPIDLVVCNLYPFEQVAASREASFPEMVENIDIGGPSMIRAAAKNQDGVAVLIDPSQYPDFLVELQANSGSISAATRQRLAAAAFARTAAYDVAIAHWFAGQLPISDPLPKTLLLRFERKGDRLRYGENPHQAAAFYTEIGPPFANLAHAQQLHGKELSYNNLLDLDSALNLVKEFAHPAAVVIKHNNPCGAATADTLALAFRRAFEGDPLSAYGGILGFNRVVDSATAFEISEPNRFVECIVAPDFEPAALEILTTRPSWRKNVRLLKVGDLSTAEKKGLDYRRVEGGLLVQERDQASDDPTKWKTVTQREPTPEEYSALMFAWFVCKHVKSNAIVLASGTQVVGVGAGQMSRVDSVHLAIRKAGDRARQAVLASDAFFPFRDNVDAAAAAGVTAVIQPGGSQRDEESIRACDEHGIAMIFTGMRHFRH